MYVERYGTGREIYFGLHGWSGSHRTFAPLAEIMPASASLYAADLPGYGLSPAPTEWSLSLIVDEIVAAISKIESRHVTLIGNCSGAILALLATERISERVKKLILIDPFAYWPWYFRVFVNKNFGRRAYNTTFANPVGRWLTNKSLKSHRVGDTDLTQSFVEVNHEATYQYLLLLSELEGFKQFQNLRLPVEIAYGEKTFGAVKKSVALWRSIWPQARAYELEGAGHLPIQEATVQLGQIVFAEDDAIKTEALMYAENEVRV